MSEILERILTDSEKRFGKNVNKIIEHVSARDPFENLVLTIISQNTNWKNVEKARDNLVKILGKIDLESFLKVDLKTLENALRPAGLYKRKAKILKSIAKIIHEKLYGKLMILAKKPLEETRNFLLSLPGVGYKTADVILAFNFSKPVIPIDTHIARVCLRIGLVKTSKYEVIKEKLENYIPENMRLQTHFLLIEFGRNICKAKRPLCEKCYVKTICPSSLLSKSAK